MSLWFVLALVAVIIVLLILRLTTGALSSWARAIRPRDAALAVLGLIGLLLHCVAMFNQPLIGAVPGAAGYATAVNQMSGASIALYIAPAGLLLAGLRAQRRPVLTLLVASLLAVGITMYDGGSLAVHLTCIFVSVAMLSGISTLLITEVRGPGRVTFLG